MVGRGPPQPRTRSRVPATHPHHTSTSPTGLGVAQATRSTVSRPTGGVTGAWSDVAHLGHAADHAAQPRIHAHTALQPPGPRGADDSEDKVHDAAATSTEEGQRPGSPHHKAPLGHNVQCPTGHAKAPLGTSPTGRVKAPPGTQENVRQSLRASMGSRPPCPGP